MKSNGLSDHLSCSVLLAERGRREVAQASLLAQLTLEDLDVLRDFSGVSIGAVGDLGVVH